MTAKNTTSYTPPKLPAGYKKGDATARCQCAALQLSYAHPHFGIPWSRVQLVEDPTIETFCISQTLKMWFSPALAMALPGPELMGVLAHEMLHPVLDHFDRARALGIVNDQGKVLHPEKYQLFGQACDMAINSALRTDKLQLPVWVLYPPADYQGPLSTEAIYQHLAKQAKAEKEAKEGQGQQGNKAGKGQKAQQGNPGQQGETDPSNEGQGQGNPQPLPGAGCMPQGDPQGTGEQGDEIDPSGKGPALGAPSDAARELAEQIKDAIRNKSIGSGSSALNQLLEHIPSRTDWRQILTGAFSTMARTNKRDLETYSRRNRRSPVTGVQLPGQAGTDPKIAVAIDCSSSMDREWIKAIVGHVVKLSAQYQGVSVYLVTHTEGVTWQGWIKRGGNLDALKEATAFEGGTYVAPAYEAIKKAGKFDYMVHFTDCEVENPWPEIPARRGVIGAYGAGAIGQGWSKPPPNARLLPCSEGE